MTDNITLPRSVVEQALEALESKYLVNSGAWRVQQDKATAALRAALEQPHDHHEQHLNMVPEGWKLVPVEPTDDMLYDIQEYSHILPPRGKRIWAHMLNAAPQPPVVEQPQGEQEPVTARHRFRNPQRGTPDWSVWQPCKVEKRPVWEIDSQGFEVEYQALYTHPQPQREPLTGKQQIAKTLCLHGLALVKTANGYDVLKLGQITAHKIGGEA